MKILEMHIYGFGQLENVEITDLHDFQVFYGENEAGKSTIMAFIHAIIFGFPTKQQTTELRYEPKYSTKYGGKIRIFHEKHGGAVIERVKGKAAGDVKVYMDNGRMGGEELLKELIANFDKSLFQSIFSFNLQGLQNIHQMKSEEIGKFLFSAGTLGTERLSKTETVLQKELDARFKPSGKKPLLNERLQALHEINKELKAAESKNRNYTNLVEKKEMLEKEMKAVNQSLQEIKEKIEKLNEWKRIESIVKDERLTKKELNELRDVEFPVRGIERIEKINELIHPYKAEINSISERIENLREEAERSQPNQSFLKQEPAILALLDQVPLYDQLKQERLQYETKLIAFEEELSITREKLHLHIDEEEILALNTNIYMKNQVEVVSQKIQKLKEVKEELENQYQEEKGRLEEIEKEVRSLERQVLTKQERLALEEKVKSRNDKESIEKEIRNLGDKIDFYQQFNERDKAEAEREGKQKNLQYVLFEVILIAITVYGVATKQWFLFTIGILGCILLLILMTKKKNLPKGAELNQTLNELIEKKEQLERKLQSAQYIEISKLEEQLALDNQRRAELQIVKIKLKHQHSQYEKIIAKFEQWELESAQTNEKLASISRSLRIPEYIAEAFLLEAYKLIEQFKVISREKKQYHLRLQQIEQQQEKIENGLNHFSNLYLNDKGLDLYNGAYLLRNKLKEEHAKQIMSQERNVKLSDFEADLRQKVQAVNHLQTEFNNLISSAKVDTEQQFYELGAKAEKHGQLLEKLKSLQSQLQYSILSDVERETFLQMRQSTELVAECNQQVHNWEAKLKELQEEQASIKYEIQILEEGGVYSDILHHYKQKKFELEEAAKEWSVYCVAQQILSNTIEKYKNIHLPRMISKAEEYLLFLTDGNYQRIHLQSSGSGFLVERKDHTIFEANELSQATTEQLYVAIRLAFAVTVYEKYQFPIIIDDSFVNFDAKRTEKVLELLKGMKRNQLLFFTCHKHLLTYFQRENVLFLEKGAVQIIS
ncbi:AAA family ATPase [Neobacillus sp. MER 74]|uniref:AAA family ATPase n=1 Tax=Neobacillus sp. MER 74 TaxID=2939566 RepID=UPI00203DD2EA|nr:AAA family ATPase [Neobacillus sp. MER 74]MCM3114372.1 AAA family ATPase [Neobacillus sp. MER 74]